MPPDCICTRICHHIDHFLLPNPVYVQPNPSQFQRFIKSDIDHFYAIFPWNQPMVTEIESLLCVYSTRWSRTIKMLPFWSWCLYEESSPISHPVSSCHIFQFLHSAVCPQCKQRVKLRKHLACFCLLKANPICSFGYQRFYIVCEVILLLASSTPNIPFGPVLSASWNDQKS